MKITNPVLIDGMSDTDYHGHPGSLSTSGAKKLLPPSCPAKFKASLGKEEHKPEFDFGKVVHTLVLGEGAQPEIVEAKSWQTKAAKEAQDEARGAGKVPILAGDWEVARKVAASVKAHPVASALFTDGKAEQSAFWVDEETGVVRRARFDWLRSPVKGKRLLLTDLKTARSAEPEAFGKAVADFGYAMQAAAYIDAAIALGLDPDPAFLFVVVEKVEPYVVTVAELDADALQIGRYLNRKALRVYAECRATDVWPTYSNDVVQVSLPYYYARNHEEAFA